MSRISRVRAKIQEHFRPTHLEVLDESEKHHRRGLESHLRLVIVASHFVSLSLIERQRQVNALLIEEFSLGLHALAMRTLTPEEWQEMGEQDRQGSPLCRGRAT